VRVCIPYHYISIHVEHLEEVVFEGVYSVAADQVEESSNYVLDRGI
jgi:hypothetical protein